LRARASLQVRALSVDARVRQRPSQFTGLAHSLARLAKVPLQGARSGLKMVA